LNDKALERQVLLQDVLVIVAALGLSHLIRGGLVQVVPALKPAVPSSDYAHLMLVFLPTWAWCAERMGLHRVRTLTGPLLEIVRALLWTQGWGALALGLILTAAQAPLNRSLIGVYLFVSTVLLLLAKLAQRAWVARVRGELVSLSLGPGRDGAVEELAAVHGKRLEALPEVSAEALRRRLQAGGVDEIVLPPGLSHSVQRPLLECAEEAGLPVLVRIDTVNLERARLRAEVLGPALYLSYEIHEPDRPALLVKAIFDRLLAAAFLVATAPLLTAVALGVRLTSPGPALFIQRRGGLHGRPFPMLKFRTMSEHAEVQRDALLAANEMDGPVFKIRQDPRVTPFGRFLRRTSLDELPQLVNVLCGQMSLVGPRPLPVVETTNIVGPHRRRLSVRPGLTCLWQISGRNELGFQQWMDLDLQYVDNWSLGLDLAILLRTLPALLSRRGAH
jgi:exopolysaccharide biosynthesis polyprenyl glycosylphosphotransferase